jgi:hypothetical protein
MNYSHVHIVLNHFPTIGTVLGLGLFIYALLRKNDELKEISFVIFMVMALLGVPTFITGAAAERAIGDRADVGLIEVHKDAAVLAFTFLGITGTFAWLGLWQARRFKGIAQWNKMVVLVLSLITVGLMVNTGSMGGEISHPEIRAEGAALSGEAEVGLNGALEAWVLDHAWVWPTGETLHFTGMALLFGVALVVNLRLFGFIGKVPFKALHRLLPLGIFGFGISATTGMMLFNANPTRYINVPTFFLKMFMVVLAGIAVLYVTVFDETWALGADDKPPLRAKFVAVTTMALWLGILYFGRMIPFLE